MARKFLTPIDLNKLELQNARIQNLGTDPENPVIGQLYYNTNASELRVYNGSSWEPVGSQEGIEDAVAEILNAGSGLFITHNDESNTITIDNTGVISVAGTSNEVTVSASAGNVTIGLPESITVDVTGDLTGNADTASALETGRAISLGGSLSGSASFNGSEDITITAAIVADSIGLGTDTTGDYVADVTAGDGISVSGSGEGASVVVTNTGVLSLTGTENEVSVSASVGSVTIGLPDNVTIGGDLTVTGDLTVSGSTTYLNTATLEVEDNKILLNSNVTGTPTTDAGIEVERGDQANAELFWDEFQGVWSASNGSATYAISLSGHGHVASDIADFVSEVENTVDAYLVGSDSISISSGSVDVNLAASASYLDKVGGLAVDKLSLEIALVTDGFTKKYAANVGNSASTVFALEHNLGTRDVVVNVYDNATYETVEVDIARTDTNTVTITFAVAPATNAYRVVIIG
ncbi:MAG: hypothetical protein ACO295_03365 [Sediminibacterium sp.]